QHSTGPWRTWGGKCAPWSRRRLRCIVPTPVESAMTLSRRDLLSASALLLAGPAALLRAAEGATGAGPAATRPPPPGLCWNENPYGPSPAAREAVSHAI